MVITFSITNIFKVMKNLSTVRNNFINSYSFKYFLFIMEPNEKLYLVTVGKADFFLKQNYLERIHS